MQMHEPTSLRAGESAETDTALLPRPVQRAVLVVVCVLLIGAMYLMSVRGPAILFDLARGAMAYCF